MDPTKPETNPLRLPFLGPAGGAYCSMADWATFLSELMRALDGKSDYLRRETAERLFTPADAPVDTDPSGRYALGWGVVDGPEGTVYTHDGSNRLWYAAAWLFPDADRGMIAVSNGPGPEGAGAEAAQAAITVLVELYPATP